MTDEFTHLTIRCTCGAEATKDSRRTLDPDREVTAFKRVHGTSPFCTELTVTLEAPGSPRTRWKA